MYTYSRAKAIADGVLVDVAKPAREAGIGLHTAITKAALDDYVVTPRELKEHQDDTGRLWDVLWMLSCSMRGGRMVGEQWTFRVIVAKPEEDNWRANEVPHDSQRKQRLVTLKAVCGPHDDRTPCITVMRPEEGGTSWPIDSAPAAARFI